MYDYMHNVLHKQAEWAFYEDYPAVLADSGYEYFVAGYINVPDDCRVAVGYVLS